MFLILAFIIILFIIILILAFFLTPTQQQNSNFVSRLRIIYLRDIINCIEKGKKPFEHLKNVIQKTRFDLDSELKKATHDWPKFFKNVNAEIYKHLFGWYGIPFFKCDKNCTNQDALIYLDSFITGLNRFNQDVSSFLYNDETNIEQFKKEREKLLKKLK